MVFVPFIPMTSSFVPAVYVRSSGEKPRPISPASSLPAHPLPGKSTGAFSFPKHIHEEAFMVKNTPAIPFSEETAALSPGESGKIRDRYRLFQLLNPLPSTSDASTTDMKAVGSCSARNFFSCMACLGSRRVRRTGRGCLEYPPMPSSLVTPL